MDEREAQVSSGTAQRRSRRVLLKVLILVQGETHSGGAVLEETQTMVVNAHGALIALAMPVEVGQRLLLKNPKSRNEQTCEVVYVGPMADGKVHVGVEFTQPASRFWPIAFPPEDWRRDSTPDRG